MNILKLFKLVSGPAMILVLLAGCAVAPVTSSPSPTTGSGIESGTAGLSEAEIATLSSLERVDDYPLYTMHFYGAYESAASGASRGLLSPPAWSCSLFAALADADHRLYGRNFDWRYSPALLLFTDPPDGYASVSMVDIAYLGFDGAKADTVTDSPLDARRRLLEAPHWPFDGMNEHGLAVGMAAVPESPLPRHPDKPTVGSLIVIREMLDHARDVGEALEILQRYNVDWSGARRCII